MKEKNILNGNIKNWNGTAQDGLDRQAQKQVIKKGTEHYWY